MVGKGRGAGCCGDAAYLKAPKGALIGLTLLGVFHCIPYHALTNCMHSIISWLILDWNSLWFFGEDKELNKVDFWGIFHHILINWASGIISF